MKQEGKNMESTCRMLLLQGISGSGKSTYANKLKEEDPNHRVIISRDELRAELLGRDNIEPYFRQGMNEEIENEITKIAMLKTASALKMNKNVIIDNTNLRRKYVSDYIKVAIDMGLAKDELQIKRFEIDVETAYKRVAQRDKFPVAKDVIRRQYDTWVNAHFTIDELWENITKKYTPKQWYLPPFEVKPKDNSETLPKAIICDLDGTLAHRALLTEPFFHYRSFYDYAKCATDNIDSLVADVVRGLWQQDYIIFFVSGRKSSCRHETQEFIERALGFKEQDYFLLMRDESIDIHWNMATNKNEDDPDDKVKYRLYNEYIRGKYNVIGAIDDRKRVVAVWEQLGLRVLNVGLLNENF